MWRLADHADAAATQTASHTISLRCVNAIGHGDGQSAYGELGSDEMALVLAEPARPRRGVWRRGSYQSLKRCQARMARGGEPAQTVSAR